MKITVVTLFPKLFQAFLSESIVKRAIDKQLVDIQVVNLREFAKDSYGSVDDRPYGGGAGMLLRVDCVVDALKSIESSRAEGGVSKKILTSAKGTTYSQNKAIEFSKLSHLVIIAGHYEGVDERVLDYIDEEVSIGDFVMTGGEIASAAIIDSIVRLIPQVLKKEAATEQESFYEVAVRDLMNVVPHDERLVEINKKGIEALKLLEYPHYTRPEEYDGKKVPEILLSGNHTEIEKWRMRQTYLLTKEKRPDLLDVAT